MFKVGSRYEFTVIEAGDETTFWGTIESYEHPLIKLEDRRASDMSSLLITDAETGKTITEVKPQGVPAVMPGRIINVTSPNFISAVEKL